MQQYDNLTRLAKSIKDNIKISDVINQYTQLKRDGELLKGLCPFHKEYTPSFKVYDNTCSYHCYGCGAHGDVFDFLGKKHGITLKQAVEFMGGRFIDPIPKTFVKPSITKASDYVKLPEFNVKHIYSAKSNKYINTKAEKIYKYEYGDGKPAGYVLRTVDEFGKKCFWPVGLYEHPKDGLVWAFGGLGSPRPLYNLPNLIKVRDKPVLIVEGEKCADAAKALLSKEFVVTTWCGGSNAVDKTDWGILESREVFIWPDNDDGGKEAADKICTFLQDIEIIPPRDEWPEKWDIADEIEKGTSREELVAYILRFRTPKAKPIPVTYNYEIPPGLLGELTQYILTCSPIRHPILAIGAAITVMAILQAQKCITEDNIHPNIYILTLAPSGSGKSFPLKIAIGILNMIGLGKLITNKPASGAGLISALHRRKGRLICFIDEFGAIFSGIMSSEAGGYQRDIVNKMMQLYSASDGEWYDEECSDREKTKELRIIRKPNLILYGTTIPDNFYNTVNADDSINGFLARLLVLQGVDINTSYHNITTQNKDMPPALLNALMQWAYDPTNIWGDSNEYNFSPIKIPFESEARRIIYKFRDDMVEVARLADINGDLFKSSLFKRCYEHASKLALLSRSNSRFIDVEAVNWGIKLAKDSVAMFYEEGKNYMYDGNFSKTSKAVERYLKKKEKWTTLTEIYCRFRMPKKQMQDILDYLLEADIIEFKVKKSRLKTQTNAIIKPLYRYKEKN